MCMCIISCITVVGYDINEYIKDYFTSVFRFVYRHPLFPVQDDNNPTILPLAPIIKVPMYKRSRVRSTTNRVEGNGRGLKKPRTCNNCKQVGSYNRMTCMVQNNCITLVRLLSWCINKVNYCSS